MAAPSAIGDLVTQITDDVKTIVKGEINLAKAEMVPQIKRAGIGGGMLGAAGYLAISALALVWLLGSVAFMWLYDANGLDTYPAALLGLTTMIVILFAIAAVLALLGKKRVEDVSGPTRTVATGQATVEAAKQGLQEGRLAVAAELSDRPQLKPAP